MEGLIVIGIGGSIGGSIKKAEPEIFILNSILTSYLLLKSIFKMFKKILLSVSEKEGYRN